MIETLLPVPVAMRVIDGRGLYDPGPLEELVLAARIGWLGETIAVRVQASRRPSTRSSPGSTWPVTDSSGCTPGTATRRSSSRSATERARDGEGPRSPGRGPSISPAPGPIDADHAASSDPPPVEP